MRRIRKDFVIVLTLVGFFLMVFPVSSSGQSWGWGASVCGWFSGGCYSEVLQLYWGVYPISWRLSIICFWPVWEPDFGIWWDWGAWGGDCPTFWFPLPF